MSGESVGSRNLLSESAPLIHNQINVDDDDDDDNHLVSGDGLWRVKEGDFIGVNAFLIACRCAKSPRGPAPAAHLGDGCLDLVTVSRCSRVQFLRFLAHQTSSRKNGVPEHLKMPFVDVQRVRAFRFQALDDRRLPITTAMTGISRSRVSVWCVDGEVLDKPNITCW